MAYSQTGPVIVRGIDKSSITEYLWATRVMVDRKGTLHVYGHHRQHAVFLEGQWSAYVVSAPTRAEILGDGE